MSSQGAAALWGALVLCCAPVWDVSAGTCGCPGATVLPRFPSVVLREACCLNFSGSSFGRVAWSAFSNVTSLMILDLSECNITQVVADGLFPAQLKELYLGKNGIRLLPDGFLANASELRVLDLGENVLEGLPDGFVQASASLQELYLDSNHLSALPRSVFQPGLQRMNLSNNLWDCSCALVDMLQGLLPPEGNASDWNVVAGNLTCASPPNLVGQAAWLVQRTEACRRRDLTTIFVLFPLLIFITLVLCWCYRKKLKKKEATLNLAKQASRSPKATGTNGVEHGQRHKGKAPAAEPAGTGTRDALLKNQLMLRPSSALLGSSRDLYEEVEIRLGSEGSLVQPVTESSNADSQPKDEEMQEPQEDGGGADLETVSVSEVMKDSADREKMYLTQSTEYYSLVPGIDLEDSDHAEYESVDLS